MVKKSEERLERILREDPMRALLHQRMKAAGVSMAALARQIGRGTSYVFDFFHRQTPKYLPEQERAMVAGILDIPESDLRPPARSAPSRVRPRPPANGGRDLPIFGVSPLNEYLVLANPPKIEAWVDRPPILVGITDGYALRVIKRIMEPRFFPGEILYDVFVALTDALCPPGGTIDEAIARDAMLETVAALAEQGVGNFDELTAEDLQEFFIGVVSRSIEGKILNEVGTNSVRISPDLAAVERAQRMLHDFVDGCVRDRFDRGETSLSDISNDQIDSFVSDLYAAAFDLIQMVGEES